MTTVCLAKTKTTLSWLEKLQTTTEKGKQLASISQADMCTEIQELFPFGLQVSNLEIMALETVLEVEPPAKTF